MLNEHPGLISATKFVGQSQGKQEIDKGFNQKEQKRVGAGIQGYLGSSQGEGC
jgi:ERCC4-related helicase